MTTGRWTGLPANIRPAPDLKRFREEMEREIDHAAGRHLEPHPMTPQRNTDIKIIMDEKFEAVITAYTQLLTANERLGDATNQRPDSVHALVFPSRAFERTNVNRLHVWSQQLCSNASVRLSRPRQEELAREAREKLIADLGLTPEEQELLNPLDCTGLPLPPLAKAEIVKIQDGVKALCQDIENAYTHLLHTVEALSEAMGYSNRSVQVIKNVMPVSSSHCTDTARIRAWFRDERIQASGRVVFVRQRKAKEEAARELRIKAAEAERLRQAQESQARIDEALRRVARKELSAVKRLTPEQQTLLGLTDA